MNRDIFRKIQIDENLNRKIDIYLIKWSKDKIDKYLHKQIVRQINKKCIYIDRARNLIKGLTHNLIDREMKMMHRQRDQ